MIFLIRQTSFGAGVFKFSFVLVIFMIVGLESQAQQETYGAYGVFPQSPTRQMAMGGAYVGLSDDISGIVFNPAGFAQGDYWGDLGGNATSVADQEADLNGDGAKDGLPYTYLYYAGGLRLGRLGLGAGFSSPYLVNLSFSGNNGGYTDTRKITLQVTSLDVMLGYRIANGLSAGVTVHGQQLQEQYQLSSTNPSTAAQNAQTKTSNTTVTSGILFRPNRVWGLGLTYTPFSSFYVDPSLNNSLGVQWFKSVYIPEKASLGLSFVPSPRWTFVADFDVYGRDPNSVLVGSQLIPQLNRVPIIPDSKYLVHGGLEWNFYDSRMWDFYLRGGGYYEPPRVVGSSGRTHTTFGFGMRYWVISFSVSADLAPTFVNASAGIGLSLKPYL